MKHNTYSTLIVDDEESGRENLRLYLQDYFPELKIVATAKNPFEAKLRIEELMPDIIFLDIHMGTVSGIELLESLNTKSSRVIFVTAYKEHALHTLKSGAIGYILKPIILEELQNAVSLAKELTDKSRAAATKESVAAENYKILIQHHTGYRYITPGEIMYSEAYSNYCKLYLSDNETITISKTLKWLEEKINSSQFYRVHKSYLVNLWFVKQYQSIGEGVVILKNNVTIRVAVSKRARLREMLALR